MERSSTEEPNAAPLHLYLILINFIYIQAKAKFFFRFLLNFVLLIRYFLKISE
jgi:hypothetical protein